MKTNIKYPLEVKPPSTKTKKGAMDLSMRLAQANAPGVNVKKVNSDAPPGRINMRAIIAETQRPHATGRKAKAFTRKVRTMTPKAQLEICFMGDVSGSMTALQEPLAVTRWMVTEAGKRVQARVSAILFGERIYPVQRPGKPLTQIEVFAGDERWESPASAWAFWTEKTGILDHQLRKGIVVFFSDLNFVQNNQSTAFHAVVEEARMGNITLIVVVPDGYTGKRNAANYGITSVVTVNEYSPDQTAIAIGDEILRSMK